MSAACSLIPARHSRAADARLVELHDWIRGLTVTSRLSLTDVDRLIDHRFLHRQELSCATCHSAMELATWHETPNYVTWRCPTAGCRNTHTVTTDSFFHRHHVSIIQMFMIARMLESRHSFTQIAREVDLTRETVRAIWIEMIDRMQAWLDAHLFNADYVFGRWDQIEIDEAMVKWKAPDRKRPWVSGDSQANRGDWIVGMISRVDRRIVIQCIEDRTRESLIEPIQEALQRGATVITDALVTYDALDTDYDHHTINKRVDGFAQVQSCERHRSLNVHVNHCESLWSKVRDYARQRHINRRADAPYLCIEFMFNYYNRHLCDALKVDM
jgi:hypothetical protein